MNKNSIKYYFIYNITLMILLIITSLFMQSVSVFSFGLIIQILIGFLAWTVKGSQMKYMYTSYIFGFIFVSLMYLALITNHGVPYINANGSDDLFFERQADYVIKQDIATRDLFEGDSLDLAPQYLLYVYLISKMMMFSEHFDGYHEFMSRQLNLTMVVIIVVMMSTIVEKNFKFSKQEYNRILLTLAIFPNLLNIASYTFRDTLSLILVVTLLWTLTNIRFKDNLLKTIPLILIILGVLTLQFYVRTFAVYVMIIIILIYGLSSIHKKYKFLFGVGTTFSIFLAFYKPIISIFNEGAESIETYSDYRANENNSTLVSIFTNAPLLPFGIVLRFLYGLIQPNPSFGYLFDGSYSILYSILTTIIGVGTLYVLLQLPYAIKGFMNPFDKFSVIFLVLYTIFLSSLTFRHLIFIYPVLFILIARGREKGITKYKTIYKIYMAAICFLYVLNSI